MCWWDGGIKQHFFHLVKIWRWILRRDKFQIKSTKKFSEHYFRVPYLSVEFILILGTEISDGVDWNAKVTFTIVCSRHSVFYNLNLKLYQSNEGLHTNLCQRQHWNFVRQFRIEKNFSPFSFKLYPVRRLFRTTLFFWKSSFFESSAFF